MDDPRPLQMQEGGDKPMQARTTARERKGDALLRAAISAFNRQGFHQTSLDEIGEKFGLTKAALYYYFPNKSALLAACFDRAMSLTRKCLDRARVEGSNGREKLILFFKLYIEVANEDLSEYFLLTEDFALEAEYKKKLVVQRDAVETELRELVREGIRDGSIVECDPKLAVFLLLGAVNWIPKWFSSSGAWSYRQLAQATAEMLDRMLSTTASVSLTRDVATIAAEPDAFRSRHAPLEPAVQDRAALAPKARRNSRRARG
jgi:TetR/AcrR family transcriptional regulator